MKGSVSARDSEEGVSKEEREKMGKESEDFGNGQGSSEGVGFA